MLSDFIHWIDTVVLFDFWYLSFSFILFSFTISSPWRLLRNKNIYLKNKVVKSVLHLVFLSLSLILLYRYLFVVDLLNKADIYYAFYFLFLAILLVGKLLGKVIFDSIVTLCFRNRIDLTDFYVKLLKRLSSNNLLSSLVTPRLFFIAPLGNAVEKRIHHHLNHIQNVKGHLAPLPIANRSEGKDSEDDRHDNDKDDVGGDSDSTDKLINDSDRYLPFLLNQALILSRIARTREPIHAFECSLNHENDSVKQAYKGDRRRIQVSDFVSRVFSYLEDHDFESDVSLPWSATSSDDVFLLEIQSFSWCLLLRNAVSLGRDDESFFNYYDLFEVWAGHLNILHKKDSNANFKMSGLEIELILEHKEMIETLLDLGNNRHEFSSSDFKVWTTKYYNALDVLCGDDLEFDKAIEIDILRCVIIALYFRGHRMHSWAQNLLSRVLHLVSFVKPESPVRALLARLYYDITVEINEGTRSDQKYILSKGSDEPEDLFDLKKWSSSRLSASIHVMAQSHIGKNRLG